MNAVHNSVETVNAAATAIVSAESRVQPIAVRRKRWGIRWNLYWCFGSHKQTKKISHSVLVPETVVAGVPPVTSFNTENMVRPINTVLLPFIAPPSSPASFLQSDPPSSTQSPSSGLLSLSTAAAANAYSSSSNSATVFAIGPYAHETQLVSPPVFSTFTTEPSTASFTPPTEPVQFPTTTPSSPEVPFAQLLASSLGRARRNNGGGQQKFLLSQYEYQPYPLHQGSNLVSPGSGVSSPFLPGKSSIGGEVPKLLNFDYFGTGKWGSRLGSGCLTPDGTEPVSRDSYIHVNQMSEVASLGDDQEIVDHRVSFELIGQEVSLAAKVSESLQDVGLCNETRKKAAAAASVMEEGDQEQCPLKQRSVSMGSVKEFNFDNRKEEEVSNKTTLNTTKWWVNNDGDEEKEVKNKWAFFSMVQSGAS
ncbi:uncharacterized protein LOC124931369 [Impatiens glandulifera]|uniref:uncharacterized protein LOC124931369 n=1 Tax=Impatiens glandulifera TaxID=253017 RepID=UPI001FB1551E|nr:uncharacterized protein LOC124931369 [Impatiens glandulifera]